MALIGINSVGANPRKPSTLEKIAQGVEIATNILGTGIKGYGVIKDSNNSTQATEDKFAGDFRPATTDEMQKGMAESVKGRQGQYIRRPAAQDPLLEAMKLNMMGQQNTKLARDNALPNVTKSEETRDSKFAESWGEYNDLGGYANIESQLVRIDETIDKLEKNPGLTGSAISGNMSKEMADIFAKDQAALEDNIAAATFGSLRAILGPAFTEKEGQRVMKTNFARNQPAGENIKRLQKLKTQIAATAAAKESAGRWFEDKRTLRGFKGKLGPEMLSDIMKSADSGKEAAGSVTGGAPAFKAGDRKTFDGVNFVRGQDGVWMEE